MATSRYQPEVHRPCTKGEIQKISQDLKFNCSPAMVEALTENITAAMQSLNVLDTLVDFVPGVKYSRTPGYKPEHQHRFGNAWAWRCDISGAPSGKLFGKTFAIKDNCAVAGVPMSYGSLLLEGYTPEYDATVVTRILDAGGRILGKSSCDEMCLGGMGFSSSDGFITLPNNPDKCVGGSSAGSAVLVACGQVDMAIATDQGGSIRCPAARTGTVGLKPTHGLVPYTGLISSEPTVDHVGPIARTVHDCALFLEVLAGNDGLDDRQMANVQIPEYSKLLEQVDVKGKKLGVLKEGFELCVEETQTAVREFLTSVGKAGLVTEGVSVPWHTFGRDIYLGIMAQGCRTALIEDGGCSKHIKGFYSTSLEKALHQGFQTSAHTVAPCALRTLFIGEMLQRRYGNHYYTKARNLSITLTRQYDEALKKCDVIVMPTLQYVPAKFVENKDTAVNAYIHQSFNQTANTCVMNVTGHPALTLPLGRLTDGNTDALMIVGRKYDELTLLQVARALEKIILAREGLH